jgi:ribosomal protein S18 acetylase RimI-like enzyme
MQALRDEPRDFFASVKEEEAMSDKEVEQNLSNERNSRVFGAFVNLELVGSIGAARLGRHKQHHLAIVWGLFVVSSARRRGVASRLLSTATQYLSSLEGIERIDLEVRSNNARAIALYLSCEFEVTGFMEATMKFGEEAVSFVRMSRLPT